MKNSMKVMVGIVALLFATSGFSFGQKTAEKIVVGRPISSTDQIQPGKDEVKVQKNRSLEFKNESKPAEIKINITEEYNTLAISISCLINQGSAVVEILDPKGKVRGTFTATSDESIIMGNQTISHANVSTQMEKNFKSPEQGDWIIRVKPESATGLVSIAIIQQYQSGGEVKTVQGFKTAPKK